MRSAVLTFFAIALSTFSFAQEGLSFYHLGDATFQNTSYNPAFMPEGKWFIGLPGISGINVHLNSRVSYNDIADNDGEQAFFNVDRGLKRLQRNNMLKANVGVNLFHLGYRFSNGVAISVFANERVEADLLYPRSLAEFLFEGTGQTLGEEINVSGIGVSATHFREIGVGFAKEIDERLRVGGRVKYLQGFFNYSTPGNLRATLTVDPVTYRWDFETQNVKFRTSGLNIYQGDEGDLGSHLVAPGNSGFAIDAGFEYRLNRDWSVAVSLTDLGYISWKTDISTKSFQDTTFSYSGVDLRQSTDFEQALTDSLIVKLKETNSENDTYTTLMSPKLFASSTYHYSDETQIIASAGARYIQGQLKMLYGVGIRQRVGPVLVSGNATKLPQQFVNLGAAFSVQGGPVQYYMAMDQLINFSVPKFRSLDVRLGLNIRILDREKGPKDVKSKPPKVEGAPVSSFLGKEVRARRTDGIYSVIKRQNKRSKIKSIKPSRKSTKKLKRRKRQ